MTEGGHRFHTPRFSADKRGAEAFVVTPFDRLARTHVFTIAGDTLVTIALADSLFLSIDPNDARWRVLLYLVLTMAPFAVVAPWLGPLMDRLRGGHRAMVLATTVARAVVALLIARHIDGLVLFPLAFTMLVLGKTYAIARSALVPSMVADHDALVGANSRLSLLSAVAGGVAAVPGALLLRFVGSSAVLALCAVVFVVGSVLAVKIPGVQVADHGPDAEERAELRGAGILLAATGMGYLRGVVGFLAMLLAFDLRGGVDPGPTGVGVELGHRMREALGAERLVLASGGSPAWHFGVVLVGVGVGGLAGAGIAPRLRKLVREEAMLTGVLAATAAVVLLAAVAGGLIGSFLAAVAVSTGAAAGKQAFDAIVQRDAPEANLGRSFARFETRFQLIWVVGALIPVVLPIPARLGFLGVAGTAAFAAFTVYYGRSPLTRLQARLSPHVERGKRRVVDQTGRVRRSRGSDGADGTVVGVDDTAAGPGAAADGPSSAAPGPGAAGADDAAVGPSWAAPGPGAADDITLVDPDAWNDPTIQLHRTGAGPHADEPTEPGPPPPPPPGVDDPTATDPGPADDPTTELRWPGR